jgi:hypothetical protein
LGGVEWIPSLVVGVVGLTGVLIGQFTVYRLQAKRWRREDAVRWQSERYRAYAEFLGKSSAWERLLLLKSHVDEDSADQLRTAMAEASDAFGAVQIFGGESVRNSAETLMQAFGERTLVVIGNRDEGGDPNAARMPKLLRNMRETIEQQMRRELNVLEPQQLTPHPWQRSFVRVRRRSRPRVRRMRWYFWRQRRRGNLPVSGQGHA